MSFSDKEYQKALESLSDAINLYENAKPDSSEAKSFRDACTHRYKYCIELSWKLSMRVLGSTTAAAIPAIREMGRNDLIDDPNLWISFIEARNNTSHTYDEKVAQKVFSTTQSFLPQAKLLLVKIQSIKK